MSPRTETPPTRPTPGLTPTEDAYVRDVERWLESRTELDAEVVPRLLAIIRRLAG